MRFMLKLWIILTLGTVLVGCIHFGSYKTEIKVAGGNTPTFGLSGSGKILKFTINGPRQRPGDGPEAYTVWEFRPIGNTDDLDVLDRLKTVQYGVVPTGYKQLYPENNLPPPSLVEGESYLLQIFTENAPWGQKAFELRGDNVFEVPIK